MNEISQENPQLENLGWRERQLVETVYRLEEASVTDILKEIPNPPTYSAVRAMLNMLVQKGYLEHRQEKVRYLYRPVVAKETARKSVLKNLLDTFFGGSPTEVVSALLDVAAEDLTESDYKKLKQLIRQSGKRGEK